MIMAFECKKCLSQQAKTFSRDAFETGVVICKCDSCSALHLVADNLNYFGDQSLPNYPTAPPIEKLLK